MIAKVCSKGKVKFLEEDKNSNSVSFQVIWRPQKDKDSVFNSEYVIQEINGKGRFPMFNIFANDFSLLDYLNYVYKFEERMLSRCCPAIPKDAIFTLFLCEVLKEKHKENPNMLKQVRELQFSAEELVNEKINEKIKSLTATKGLLEINKKGQQPEPESEKV